MNNILIKDIEQELKFLINEYHEATITTEVGNILIEKTAKIIALKSMLYFNCLENKKEENLKIINQNRM